MNETECPVVFTCGDDRLMGVLHRSSRHSDTVFVFVVGGPQYRVGSHRMFVELARGIASGGLSVLRFDCRGMGDSDGMFESFENLDVDIRSAIDCVVQHAGARRVILLGLCDGASACAMYAHRDARVSGVVLLNPWVRTESAEARVRVQSYYGRQLLQGHFWRRLISGKIDIGRSIGSLVVNVRTAFRRVDDAPGYVDRMFEGLSSFQGAALVLLSEKDLVAQEFSLLCSDGSRWEPMMRRAGFERAALPDADHTLSDPGQISAVAASILTWARRVAA